MLQTSPAFKTAIDADIRSVKATAVIDFTAPFLDESIRQTVPEGAFDYLGWDKKKELTDAEFEPTHKYFILGQSKLNSGDKLASADNETGWWSKQKSLSNGLFNTPIVIEIAFVSRTIKNILLYGDNKLKEYPVAFEIELFNGMWQTVVTENENTVIKYVYTLNQQLENITKMRITLSKWSKGLASAKIIEAYASNIQEYSGKSINEFTILEERNYDNGSLPIGNVSANEVNLNIIDDQLSISDMVQNKPITVQIGCDIGGGEIEFVPAGVFYSKNWTNDNADNSINVIAHDAVSLLNETTFSNSNLMYNQSLKALTLLVLQDSQLLDRMYVIDDALDDIVVPVVYFNTASHMNVLRLIVEAALGVMYADKRGVVQVMGEALSQGSSPVTTLTTQTHILDGQSFPIDVSTITNVVEVFYYEYQLLTRTIIYESVEPIDISAGETESVTLFFQLGESIVAYTNVLTSVFTQSGSDIVIDRFIAYTWGINITFKNNGSTNQSVLTINVEGQPLKQKEKVYTASDTESILKYGKHTFELKNYLIQSRDRAKMIAESLLSNYNSPNKDTIVPTWGNPAIEVGDVVTLDNATSQTDVQIYRQNIKYDNGLDIELKGRKVN